MYTLRAQESKRHCSPQSSALIFVYILAGISYEKIKLNHTKKVPKLRIMNIVYRNILYLIFDSIPRREKNFFTK